MPSKARKENKSFPHNFWLSRSNGIFVLSCTGKCTPKSVLQMLFDSNELCNILALKSELSQKRYSIFVDGPLLQTAHGCSMYVFSSGRVGFS